MSIPQRDDAVVAENFETIATLTTKKKNKERRKKLLKVTLLSGFLGAGKTTLLKRILRVNNNKEDYDKLRIAVIVNDMGEINLDAEEIKTSKVIQEDTEIVEMHNGCICCTLRGDLLKTVKRLSEDEANFDYLVIESTGISEPLPVAQTFVMNVDGMMLDDDNEENNHSGNHNHHNLHQQKTSHHKKAKKKTSKNEKQKKKKKEKNLTVAMDEKHSLFHYAKLDTLVTVVDALNIYDVLGSIETLAKKDNITGMTGKHTSKVGGNIQDDDRYSHQAKQQYSAVLTAVRSMEVEQLRMALQANGLATAITEGDGNDKEKLMARLIANFESKMEEEYADNRSIVKLWLDQIEFANVIVISKVSLLLKREYNGSSKLKEIENLLHKLNPDANIIVPYEDNYNDLDVSTTLVNTNLFNMKKAQSSLSWIRELEAEEHNPETEEYGISSVTFVATNMPFHPERLYQILENLKAGYNKNKDNNDRTNTSDKNKFAIPFQGVARIKGQIWLANCNVFPLSLQSAGRHVELQPGSTLAPFLVEKPRGHWTEADQRAYQWILDRDWWSEKWGDRRSQLVIIGVGLEPDSIRKIFEDALLTEEEDRIIGGPDHWHRLKDPIFNGRLIGMCKSYYASLSRRRDPRAIS